MSKNQHTSGWTDESVKRLFELRAEGLKDRDIADKLTKEFGYKFTPSGVKSKRLRTDPNKIEEVKPYKETVEIKGDTQVSDRLIELSEDEIKDEVAVLKAHGYDPSEWEIINAKNSMWHHFNKKMKHPRVMYASKITVKPKRDRFDWDEFIEIIKEVPKITIKPKVREEQDKYLLLPLFDMHFGISNYKYYMPTQAKILQKLNNNYKEVALIFGQDAFHNDDFYGRTTKGTQIQKVDMIQAWKDAVLFFEPIIKKALEQNSKVKIYYSKGNHSETIEWAFIQYLKARFPQCEYDDTLKERKVVMLGKNFIGMNHGDKKNEKRLPENFATEFPIKWARATTRTVFTGHRHSELVEDAGGILVRRMPTKNITDDWHDDMGYTTQHKRFQIHEFGEEEQIALYYV